MTSATSAAPVLERIVVIGAGHHEASTDAREAALGHLPALGARLDERLQLTTCHRAELFGVGAGVPDVGPPLRVRRGRAAVERILSVVAGLDSAIVGEQELLGQVRDAYRAALDAGTTGPILNQLMRRSLHVGRRARSMAGTATDRSLADRALAGVAAHERALVVGSGAMAERICTVLAGRGSAPTVASRTPSRARALARRVGGVAMAWHPELLDGPWDLVALATRVDRPLLARERARTMRAATVIDLCAPSAVAADARPILGRRLVDLDTLGAEGPSIADPHARRRIERLVQEETDRFITWLAELPAFDAVSLLHARAAELRDRHLGRLRRSDRFDEAQLAAVDRMTTQLVGELLHEPTLRLRAGDRP